ncbi:MAG: hypothetical protein H6738_21215 [Alphaproteobacteria bacterium]|nr:hypothetical protein [Alphaproteobacteria bacterium]
MSNNGFGIAAAVAMLFTTGLAAGCSNGGAEEGDLSTLVRCEGINECAGQGECAGADGQNSCEGQNECAGMGWVTATRGDCADQGGTELGEI